MSVVVVSAEEFAALVQSHEALVRRVEELERERARRGSRYVSVDEAADRLGCDRQRIYDLRSSRRLTPFRDGGRAVVSEDEIEALVRGGPASAVPTRFPPRP